MSGDATIEVYQARAGDYAGLTAELHEMKQLKAFAAALPQGGRVLDFGCGPGFHAGWLADQGFDVEAWDGSAEMVALAQGQRGVTARLARFDALEAEGEFDGVWANFSLLHVPKAEFPGILARVHRAGKPGMAFHIAVKLGEGEGPDAIGRFYAYYREDELERLLNAGGVSVVQRWRGRGKGLSGEIAEHVMMLCHG